MSPRLSATVVLVLAILLTPGCSGNPSTETVTGSLDYQGKPLQGAMVSFTPVEGGHPATGETDSEGNYSLTTFKAGDGAVPGEYVVTVQKLLADEKGGVYAEHRLVTPDRYANASSSDLRAKVTSGESNEFSFTLKK